MSGVLSGYVRKRTDDGLEVDESTTVAMYRAIPCGLHYVVDSNNMLVSPDLWPLFAWTL
jgi:hypothetical protein